MSSMLNMPILSAGSNWDINFQAKEYGATELKSGGATASELRLWKMTPSCCIDSIATWYQAFVKSLFEASMLATPTWLTPSWSLCHQTDTLVIWDMRGYQSREEKGASTERYSVCRSTSLSTSIINTYVPVPGTPFLHLARPKIWMTIPFSVRRWRCRRCWYDNNLAAVETEALDNTSRIDSTRLFTENGYLFPDTLKIWPANSTE